MSERLSSLVDGELEEQYADRLMAQLKRDGVLRDSWGCYHLIGDTLRGVEGPDLGDRILARLDAEPTVLAPPQRMLWERLGRCASTPAAKVAGVAFVGLVGWMTVPGPLHTPVPLASIPEPKVTQVAAPADEGARDYVLAHQPFAPAAGMQGLAGYVRAMSSEGSPRRDLTIR